MPPLAYTQSTKLTVSIKYRCLPWPQIEINWQRSFHGNVTGFRNMECRHTAVKTRDNQQNLSPSLAISKEVSFVSEF